VPTRFEFRTPGNPKMEEKCVPVHMHVIFLRRISTLGAQKLETNRRNDKDVSILVLSLAWKKKKQSQGTTIVSLNILVPFSSAYDYGKHDSSGKKIINKNC
jgi:hypothetical protein